MNDEKLRALTETLREILSEREADPLFARILDSVIGLTHADRGFLVVHRKAWKVTRARNMKQEEVERAHEKISRTLLDRARQEGRPLIMSHADLEGPESVQRQKVRAVCIVPIGPDVAVYLDHRGRPDAFQKADVGLVGAFAGLAAAVLETARDIEARGHELEDARREIARKSTFERMIGASRRMKQLFRLLQKAAASPYPVLLQGESGTGKELAARAIHNRSARSGGPFIATNCGAVPDSLLASELFGHVRGAFTGAEASRAGLLELADKGTLFLDEVATMSAEMQESLLRALQDQEIRRVGSSNDVPVDVRIVAATNVDPAVLVDRGEFRKDLYYRLNVIAIELPPLRERREDIPHLVEHFLGLAAEETAGPLRAVSPEALRLLVEHPWPGNVRELENAVRRAVAMAERETLDAPDFAFLRNPLSPDPEEILHLDDYIRTILEKYEGTLGLQKIADRLGVSRKTLWDKKRRRLP